MPQMKMFGDGRRRTAALGAVQVYNDRADVKQHALEEQKKRRAEDVVFRLKGRMRARIGEALKNAGESSTAKVDSTINMFGRPRVDRALEKYGDNIVHVTSITSFLLTRTTW